MKYRSCLSTNKTYYVSGCISLVKLCSGFYLFALFHFVICVLGFHDFYRIFITGSVAFLFPFLKFGAVFEGGVRNETNNILRFSNFHQRISISPHPYTSNVMALKKENFPFPGKTIWFESILITTFWERKKNYLHFAFGPCNTHKLYGSCIDWKNRIDIWKPVKCT